MGIIINLIRAHNEKLRRRRELCCGLISDIDSAVNAVKRKLGSYTCFVEPEYVDEFNASLRTITSSACFNDHSEIKKTKNYKLFLEKKESLLEMERELPRLISSHNDSVASRLSPSAAANIGRIEGRELDAQQLICIVKDVHNQLAVAGAGTGKTTTIIGKIKHLLNNRLCDPSEILVLSFTNVSASEMRQRIHAETGENITALTFHKLGLEIIKCASDELPKISSVATKRLIEKQLDICMMDPAYLSLLNTYIIYHRSADRDDFDFGNEEEYRSYLEINPPTTLKGETVKSYGEMDIANFLYQNGVAYEYEHPYQVDTQTEEYGRYRPDFFLPDYGIYIEYFGIDRSGNVPSYFTAPPGKTASEAYCDSMAWKRELHKQNGTRLIERFAYERQEGVLLDSLKQDLLCCSVKLDPIPDDELWQNISGSETSLLDGVAELFETLINLIKCGNYSLDDVRALVDRSSAPVKNRILLSLLTPIYNAYCSRLAENGEIDFNDMINLSTEYVNAGKYQSNYKYVLVDEYQDISKARYLLLKALRRSCDFKLFCVGDDWQSIYRFAGSDIGLMTHFSDFWGPSELSKIETTYRFSQGMINISSEFIMQNPDQIKKTVVGAPGSDLFPLTEINVRSKYAIADALIPELCTLPEGSTVFFIGRYNYDIKCINDDDRFNCAYNIASGNVDVVCRRCPSIKITYLTAHRSKGLQADYVFIINNRRDRMGFPSKMINAPLLELLLVECDPYPFAEERRLFYVAITRAKKHVFLLTEKGNESAFILELRKRYEEKLQEDVSVCPLCGGALIKRMGPHGVFFGCSNYYTNGCTYTRNIRAHR